IAKKAGNHKNLRSNIYQNSSFVGNRRKLAVRFLALFLWSTFPFALFAQYSQVAHRELEEGEIPVDKPGSYGLPGATYVLTQNINSTHSGVFLGKDVTLDLNGYSITYADGDYGHLPNSG